METQRKTLSINRKLKADGEERKSKRFTVYKNNNTKGKANNTKGQGNANKGVNKGFKGKPKFKKKAELTCAKPLDNRITQEKYLEREDVQKSMQILSHFGTRFDFNDPKILSLDIHRVVIQINAAQQLGFSNVQLRKALTHYAHAPAYVKRYRIGEMRVDLFGKPVSEITKEDVFHFNKRISDLRKKMLERKRNQLKTNNETNKETQ